MAPEQSRRYETPMRACAIAVLLVLAGCDEERALEEDTAAEEESSSDDGADTFSDGDEEDGGSTDDGGEFLPMYAECTDSSECSDAEYGSGGRANYCIASTCVERVIDDTVTAWLTDDGPSPCSDPGADPVLVAIPAVTEHAVVCGLGGSVVNDLGHCDVDGMSFVIWQSDEAKLESMTCWWSPLLSGPRGGEGCSTVVEQPIDGDILPKVCG